MQDNDPQSICDSLQRLAFENPRKARASVDELLRGDESILMEVLQQISGPGNGRLRQLIANAATAEEDRARLRSHFSQWLAVEPDAFTRRAIEHARQPLAEHHTPESQGPPVSNPLLVEMYRYVMGQVRHELRNVLLAPKTKLLQLRSEIKQIVGTDIRSSLESLLSKLEDDFTKAGRVCGFEPDDDHFVFQSFVLCEWIKAMNTDYAQQYKAIGLSFEGSSDAQQARVLGSHHTLRTIFWNLWLNSHQATGDACHITISMELSDRSLILLLCDDGEGFPERLSISAFNDQVSTNSPNRGRGLLEVGCAIEELHGRAYLELSDAGELRVALCFPVVSE